MEQRPRLKGNRLEAFENITKDENRAKISNELARIISKKGIADKLESLWNKHVITLEQNDGIFKYKVKAQ